MMKGVSICFVSFQSYFYARLAVEKIREFTPMVPFEIMVFDNGSTDETIEWLSFQKDVVLFKGTGNSMRHGAAIDFLIRRARFELTCALDCDSHPTSLYWLDPALELYNGASLAGAEHIRLFQGENHRLNPLHKYISPSYCIGKTEMLRTTKFADDYPRVDTGQQVTQDVVNAGGKLQFIDVTMVDFGGKFSPKPCDYSGLVWHSWWSTRSKVVNGLAGVEYEEGYPEFVVQYLRDKYGLKY